jgi:hypothetical protein
VFNELSITKPAPTLSDARRWMTQLVQTILMASNAGAERALRSHDEFGHHELFPGYPIAKWRNDPDVDLELKRFFRTVTSKAPLLVDVAAEVVDRSLGSEYRHGGHLCHGLGAAALLDGLALSLPSERAWGTGWISISEERLLESATLQSDSIEVRNSDAPATVARNHREWLATPETPVTDGADLWRRRAELFPSLDLCARVEEDLATIRRGDPLLIQIADRLSILQRYFRDWNGTFDKDAIGTKVTPDSGAALEQHADQRRFLCPDGQTRQFSWHARMTPGAWRLYFYPDPSSLRAWIGYIGHHLRTAKY